MSLRMQLWLCAESVRLGHVVGWWKTMLLLNTSIPLQDTSNGWWMTWSGFWGMRKPTWGLARKQGGLNDHLNMPHILLFFTFEFNEELECPKSPMKTILSSFNLSNERIPFYYLCFLSSHLFFFFFFLFFLFLLPCNFFPWRPFGNFCHAYGLFPYLLPGPRFQVFNLAGFFCLNFFLGRPFGFST